MKAYTMTATGLTEHGNQLKELFLNKMIQEKVITIKQKEKMNDYCFVIAEKSLFGKIWDKIYWKKSDDTNSEMRIFIVKIIE